MVRTASSSDSLFLWRFGTQGDYTVHDMNTRSMEYPWLILMAHLDREAASFTTLPR